jgi:hypothetical protein
VSPGRCTTAQARRTPTNTKQKIYLNCVPDVGTSSLFLFHLPLFPNLKSWRNQVLMLYLQCQRYSQWTFEEQGWQFYNLTHLLPCALAGFAWCILLGSSRQGSVCTRRGKILNLTEQNQLVDRQFSWKVGAKNSIFQGVIIMMLLWTYDALQYVRRVAALFSDRCRVAHNICALIERNKQASRLAGTLF